MAKAHGRDPEDEKFIKQVAERIKSLRKSRDFTNYETFAYRFDIPRTQYGRYEKGVDLRLTSIRRLCKNAFQISLTEFFSEGFD